MTYVHRRLIKVVLPVLFTIVIRTEFTTSTNGKASTSKDVSRDPFPFDTTDVFLSSWNDMNRVLEIFQAKYQAQHHVAVLIDRELEKADQSETGIDTLYGILRMGFIFHQNGEAHTTSVLIRIPYLGVNSHTGYALSFYDKEKYMYEVVLPFMYKFWPYDILSPKLYSSVESGFLVLENLRETGFYTPGDAPLDLSKAQVVMKSIAKFHALSTSLPKEFYAHLDDLTVTDREKELTGNKIALALLKKYKKNAFPAFTESKMKELIDAMITNIGLVVNSAYSPNLTGLNVVLYGDPNWTNIFFQNDTEGNVFTCKFVNFENSRRGSPIIDVMNFLMTRLQPSIFETHFDDLYRLYANEFRAILRKLGSKDQYSLKEFRLELQKFKLYFVYRLVFNIPLIWTQFTAVSLEEKEDEYDALFKSEKYLSFFSSCLKILH